MMRNSEHLIEKTHQMKSESVGYALLMVGIPDWLYKLLRIIVDFNFIVILDYFSYLIHLWKLNSILITLIMIISQNIAS
jgi:hypothetical protein